MSTNKDKLVKEKMADIIFSYAAVSHVENINEDIENGCVNEIENPYQEELNNKIEVLINDYRRKHGLRDFLASAKKMSKIAAVVIVSILILSVTLISTVDALRIMFLNLFVEPKDAYSKIIIEDERNPNDGSSDVLFNDETLTNCYIPKYIPKGFNLENIIRENEKIIMIFMNSDSDTLIFEQSSDPGREFMVDNEEVETETLIIKGFEAITYTKDKVIIILWNNNERVFNVFGKLPKEEIIKFCESIYFKE